MLKPFVSGLLLGSLLTLLGGVVVGPTITLGDIQSMNPSPRHARYDLRVDERDGVSRYSIIDTETGTATIATGDGKTVVVKAEAPAADK